jgi:hypothetical protein
MCGKLLEEQKNLGKKGKTSILRLHPKIVLPIY